MHRELLRFSTAALVGILSLALAAPVSAQGIGSNLTAQTPEISGGAAAAILAQQAPASSGLSAAEQDALAPAAAIGVQFDAMNFDTNGAETGFLFIPPDPMGAAGPDRLVGVTNVTIESRTKAGALLWRDSLRDFFAPAAGVGAGVLGTFTFDPKIVYDQYAGRFVVVTLERSTTSGNAARILLAVSKTAAPASAGAADWWYHSIDGKVTISGSETWPDYPGFEVDEEAVYVTANHFTFAGGSFSGVRLRIIDKGLAGGFYAGGPAAVTTHDPYATGGIATTTQPAQVFGAAGVGPGIGTYLVSHSGLTDGVDEYVQVVRVNNPLGAVSFTQEFINIGNIDNVAAALPDAPQLGSAALIETNDRRALDAVWRNGSIWLTATINPNGGPNAGQCTAYWWELDASAVASSASASGLITPKQQGGIGGEDIAANTHTYFPAVAVNSLGQAKFGFSASAPSIYAGAYAAARKPSDAAGTVGPSVTVRKGDDWYLRTFGGGRNRWGDYSGIALDPNDDRIFWVNNEYAMARGTPTSGGEDGRWGTAWASCEIPCFEFTCPPSVVAPRGESKSFDICITNCGALEQKFSVSVSDANGWCSVSPSMLTVPAGQTLCATVTCDVPANAQCDSEFIVVSVASISSGEQQFCTTKVIVDCPVPIQLTAFSAERDGGAAVIEWTLHEEYAGGLFHVARETAESGRIRITEQPLAGSTHFRYVDAQAPSGEVSYWLEEVGDGASNWFGPVTLAGVELPATLALAPAQPNPFAGRTAIGFTLPVSQSVRLAIYDLQGRLVRTLVDGVRPAGGHQIGWDGRTDAGERASFGLYIVRLRAGDEIRTGKVMVTR